MEYIRVIEAAAAAFMHGAVWCSVFSKPWIKASGIKRFENGYAISGRMALPFVLSGIAILLVSRKNICAGAERTKTSPA